MKGEPSREQRPTPSSRWQCNHCYSFGTPCATSLKPYPRRTGRPSLTGWTAPPMWPRPPALPGFLPCRLPHPNLPSLHASHRWIRAKVCLSAPSSACCFDDSRLALYISVSGLMHPRRYFRPNGHQRGRRCFISAGAAAAGEAVSSDSSFGSGRALLRVAIVSLLFLNWVDHLLEPPLRVAQQLAVVVG